MTVTPTTIATALGRTAPDDGTPEADQWSMWIDDALMLIGDRLGDVEALDQAKLDYVVREAVVAQIRRPDDATTVSVTVDDSNSSRTYRTSRGRITILDEWWNLLSPPNKKKAAFGINTAPSYDIRAHAPWCDLMFLGTDCSCGVNLAGRPIYEPLP